MSRKYFIETYGCQMNYHDSEQMAGLLESAGYDRTPDDGDADVVVINTCSVREHAEDKLYTRLGELRVLARETGPGSDRRRRRMRGAAGRGGAPQALRAWSTSSSARGACGCCRCWSSRPPETRVAQVDLGAHDNVAFPFGVTRRDDPVRALGDHHRGLQRGTCSFCVVPYTRGHERMRPKAEILAEVRDAADARPSRGAAARADRQPLPGARRPGLRLRGAARGGPRASTASSASALPARIRGT